MSVLPSAKIRLSIGMAVAVVLFVWGSAADAATSFFVSTTGSDSSPGTSAKPWRTIQKSASSATPGSTVVVMPGVYSERVEIKVSGNSSQGPITFLGQQGAILDGTSIAITVADFAPAILINSQAYITITGFEIRNYVAKNANATPVGILVRGASHDIEISGNVVHNIINNINANSNAHGIAVYGTGQSQATAIHNITIEQNQLYSLKLGASESLVVNGNVDGFVIQNNSIHDCNNIGIDAIGFEGTSKDPFDQARNGLIAHNTITRIDTQGNPAYKNPDGTYDRSADGIYVDGGTNITIDSNNVSLANIGIELASEHADRITSNITVTNNVITGCQTVGMSLGGYNSKKGTTKNCLIKNNTLKGNDTDENGNGELMLQYKVQNNTLENNTFQATSQNIFISNAFTTTSGNTFDFNTYISPGGPGNSVWVWNTVEYDDFKTYQNKTGNDHHSVCKVP